MVVSLAFLKVWNLVVKKAVGWEKPMVAWKDWNSVALMADMTAEYLVEKLVVYLA